MTAAYFEDHPTDPDKVILRKPKHEDYKREWIGLTDDDMKDPKTQNFDFIYGARWAEIKLKERNT